MGHRDGEARPARSDQDAEWRQRNRQGGREAEWETARASRRDIRIAPVRQPAPLADARLPRATALERLFGELAMNPTMRREFEVAPNRALKRVKHLTPEELAQLQKVDGQTFETLAEAARQFSEAAKAKAVGGVSAPWGSSGIEPAEAVFDALAKRGVGGSPAGPPGSASGGSPDDPNGRRGNGPDLSWLAPMVVNPSAKQLPFDLPFAKENYGGLSRAWVKGWLAREGLPLSPAEPVPSGGRVGQLPDVASKRGSVGPGGATPPMTGAQQMAKVERDRITDQAPRPPSAGQIENVGGSWEQVLKDPQKYDQEKKEYDRELRAWEKREYERTMTWWRAHILDLTEEDEDPGEDDGGDDDDGVDDEDDDPWDPRKVALPNPEDGGPGGPRIRGIREALPSPDGDGPDGPRIRSRDRLGIAMPAPDGGPVGPSTRHRARTGVPDPEGGGPIGPWVRPQLRRSLQFAGGSRGLPNPEGDGPVGPALRSGRLRPR